MTKNLKITAFLIFQFLTTAVFAQVVTTEPPYATANDSIIVYFHADRGDQGLMDYSGTDVYAHTGVITNLSSGPSDWKYVIAAWDQNLPKAKLTRIEQNLWKLTIGNPYDYYGVPQNEQILKLAFVFRNSDGSRTGRGVGGADIFYELYEPGINLVILEPQVSVPYGIPERSPVFVNAGDSLKIVLTAAALGTNLDRFDLRINGMLVAQSTADTLRYTYHAPQDDHGKKTVFASATDTSGNEASETFVFMITPVQQDEDRPAGIVEGENYADDQSVTLCLFAPYKKFVYVIGDFNDWKVDEAYLMKRDSIDRDSTYYWLTISGLNAGQEYAYQYLVDGEIRIADPYTQKILDPWNDQYIPSTTYPNLKPYPSGKTDFPVSVLQTARSTYQWKVQDFNRPAPEKLIVYELLVRDFLAKHDFKTLIDTLDYLQKLGVNVIELMPINEFEGNESWGYNPSFYFAPDKYYGPAEDLKRLVDSCHVRGMAVVLDMVLNHAAGQCPLVRLYNEGDFGRPTPENPWFNVESPNPIYNWFNDFDHESPATQKFVDRVNRFWLTEYNVDGFRFDFTKGFTNTPGDGWAYDARRINILKRMADKIWEVKSDAYVILEHLTDNSEEKVLANYGMLLWGNMNYSYSEATMGYHDNNKSDLSWGYYKTREWSKPNLITYMESHDEERLMYKNLTYGRSYGSYNIKELSTALERMKLAGAFFFLLPGPKMIWQFGELGYDYSIDYNGRVGNKPIRWDYFQQEERRKLYKAWAAMIKLRNENPVFYSAASSADLFVVGAVKRINLYHGLMNASIVGNFGVTTASIQPNFNHGGWWYDFFSGDSLFVTNTDTTITLLAGEFHIYTDRKTFTPEQGLILTDLAGSSFATPEEFTLAQNYPNPFNPSTTIAFYLPTTEEISLRVYNMRGQLIKELISGRLNSGWHKIAWDGVNQAGNTVASGVYVYRLQAGKKTRLRKMILLR
ncbi:alpha-amylase family glycosyl hydrolase [Caldithrix abyssi]